ncbi:MAG: anthranilate phosphoribosyltransferase [Planctomycetes bacterium]|nr:anthranilate phosphoribosyltransferase [Planctomycetota bacterium]
MADISQLIRDAVAGRGIEPSALEDALHTIMQGDAEPVQVAGLLVALATQTPDARSLAAAARALRAHRVAIHPNVRPLVDTCGTGGDGANTFNISTAAATVVAAAGGAVAKHGNRGVSSPVGSADVLQAAGCKLDLGAERARELLDACGFVFLFAPAFHPAMAHVAPVRRSLGVRTLFNLLGPLANPALAEFQLLGVYDPSVTEVMAEALLELGSKGALVVHCDGLDECGLHAVTRGHRLRDGAIEPVEIDPESVGIARAGVDQLAGAGTAEENAKQLREALGGDAGPRSDVVALNAACALEVAGIAKDLAEGVERARDCMQSGAALRVLERYAESSSR